MLKIIILLLVATTVVNCNGGCPRGFESNWDNDPEANNEVLSEVPDVKPEECNNPIDMRYRRLDGTCNNLLFPNFGAHKTPFTRLLPPEFGNNVSSPRIISRVSNQYLPNARTISVELLSEMNVEFEATVANLLTHFGQFLAHDTTKFEETLDEEGEPVECGCESREEDCFQIIVPRGDPVLTQECIRFTRAQAIPGENPESPILHLNVVTGHLDGSTIYGSTDTKGQRVRAFFGGRLSISEHDFMPLDLQPVGPPVCSFCGDLECFLGGDIRASEVLLLNSVHLTFVREHNRIAGELAAMNPYWDDELLYQETKKINVAQFQHIVYNEWLAVVLGQGNPLIPLQSGFTTDIPERAYDQHVEPQTFIAVGSSAYRFGHTLIRNEIQRFDSHHNPGAMLNLSEIIFDATQAFTDGASGGTDGISEIITGMVNQPAMRFDGSMVDTIRNQLFGFGPRDARGEQTPLDLAALNIQRARDFAQPGYIAFANKCLNAVGAYPITNFHDLAVSGLIPAEDVDRLQQIYTVVQDIDLFVGGLKEIPRPGVLVGPTFECMLQEQFDTYRRGDRFYYEHEGPAGFNAAQLQEIRYSSMARLMCNNQGVKTMQPYAFLLPCATNARVSCDQIPSINLELWRDTTYPAPVPNLYPETTTYPTTTVRPYLAPYPTTTVRPYLAPSPYAPHPSRYAPHPAPYSEPEPYAPHPSPYAPHPAAYPAPYPGPHLGPHPDQYSSHHPSGKSYVSYSPSKSERPYGYQAPAPYRPAPKPGKYSPYMNKYGN